MTVADLMGNRCLHGKRRVWVSDGVAGVDVCPEVNPAELCAVLVLDHKACGSVGVVYKRNAVIETDEGWWTL